MIQTIPNQLHEAAKSSGLYTLVQRDERDEAIVAVFVYKDKRDNRAIVTWERGKGIVRRMGLTWVKCELSEAFLEIRKAGEDVGEKLDPLDDPRMNGAQWLDAHHVTQEMLDAWPVWEWQRTDRHLHGVEMATTLRADGNVRPWSLRPLRLPGMNKGGEIPASAMTVEHFEGVSEWQWCDLDEYGGKWCNTMWQPSMDDVDQHRESEFWRPAIFAKLDKAQPGGETK